MSENQPQNEVKITVRPNGPFRIEGAVKLVDAQGGEWDVSSKPAFSLCRCGASANKPFCDGAHNKIAFQANDTAPPPVVPPSATENS